MKTWTVKINENELRALIQYHAEVISVSPNVETSSRIHDLTKRLNKETPDVENASEGQAKVENQSVTTQW